jgi:hypothetical protein
MPCCTTDTRDPKALDLNVLHASSASECTQSESISVNCSGALPHPQSLASHPGFRATGSGATRAPDATETTLVVGGGSSSLSGSLDGSSKGLAEPGADAPSLCSLVPCGDPVAAAVVAEVGCEGDDEGAAVGESPPSETALSERGGLLASRTSTTVGDGILPFPLAIDSSTPSRTCSSASIMSGEAEPRRPRAEAEREARGGGVGPTSAALWSAPVVARSAEGACSTAVPAAVKVDGDKECFARGGGAGGAA